MSGPILIDLSHTSHTRARTGIQRVARALATKAPHPLPITFDPYEGTWRSLNASERENLASDKPAPHRGARWPLTAKLGGRLRKALGQTRELPSADLLLVPELFSPQVASALPGLFARVRGPRVALFHDAIALQQPWSAPAKTVTRFPSYLKELLRFDGIAAISEASKETLIEYWRWLGVTSHPPVAAIGLAVDPVPVAPPPPSGIPEILFVSSLEGRKNHVALLDASEALWSRGLTFGLRLIGLAHPTSGRPALDRIQALQAKGRPLHYEGTVSEARLEEAYAACTFTAYPSLAEGFGLPVLESLIRGRPCLCSGTGALGEIAQGGGCLALESLDSAALAKGLGRLLTETALRERLRNEALARSYPTWNHYATSVAAWAYSLPRRA